MTSKILRDLYCGDIDIRLYGDRDNIEVSVNQSIPQQWGKSSWYQRINHRFPVNSLAEVEAEVVKRLTAFMQANTRSNDEETKCS